MKTSNLILKSHYKVKKKVQGMVEPVEFDLFSRRVDSVLISVPNLLKRLRVDPSPSLRFHIQHDKSRGKNRRKGEKNLNNGTEFSRLFPWERETHSSIIIERNMRRLRVFFSTCFSPIPFFCPKFPRSKNARQKFSKKL